MPRHLIGDAHEWINEIPTVPTYSVAKLQPSQRSWFEYSCVAFMCHYVYSKLHYFYVPINSCVLRVGLELVIRTTAGQEDPFELDSNLLLSVDQHGEDRKRQSTPCVRPWNTATWRFGWLTVLALPSFTSISNNTRALLQSAVSVTCINPLSDLILFWVLTLEELFDHDASWGLATSVVST